MRYALLLYLDPESAARTTPEEAEAELAAYAEVTRELSAQGVLRGGEAFLPARAGTMVRVEDGRRVASPEPATDLELSGFYLIDCDEELAVDIAARMPVATHGAVAVRPLMELPAPPPG